MAQESVLQQECDLEQKILTIISDSSIRIIQGGGKSYINRWCCVHFTKGKDSDHLTIQESTCQIILAFLCFEYTNNYQIQLFHQWIKASPKERTKKMTMQILHSVDNKAMLKQNRHFLRIDVGEMDEAKINDDKAVIPGTFEYECNRIETLEKIKMKSNAVYDALLNLKTKYFVDLQKKHNIDIQWENAKLWPLIND